MPSSANCSIEYKFCPSCDVELLKDNDTYYCIFCNYPSSDSENTETIQDNSPQNITTEYAFCPHCNIELLKGDTNITVFGVIT